MELLAANQIADLNPDELDSMLDHLGDLESQFKSAQVRIVREVDRRQVPLGDGMRTLDDWIVARMDVTPRTARKLATVARADSPQLDQLLADGVSFERVANWPTPERPTRITNST